MPQYIKQFPKAIPEGLCKRLIARFDADARIKSDPQPHYSTRKYLNISFEEEWQSLTREITKYADKTTVRYFNKPGNMLSVVPDNWGNDGYVIARYGAGDMCALHYDGQNGVAPHNGLRLATQLFYLNTIEVGGETHFPLQKVKIKPEQGKCIMFPVAFTHPHEVLKVRKTSPSLAAARYVLQTWITDPAYVVLHT